MKVVFFGSSKFVTPILDVLRKNFDLKLVLTTENPALLASRRSGPAGRPKVLKLNLPNLASQGDALRSWPVVKYCVDNKIPYRSVSDLSELSLISHLSSLNSQMGVLADFGLIIPRDILNAFPKGIINIHPSLLPKYRGPTPVQTAILNGEKITGVSIIKLDDEIDHGPILRQEKEEILDTDTSETLYKRLFEKGASLLLKVLNNYLKDSLKPTPQNHKEATFTKPLTRQDGFIDVSNEVTAVTKIDTMIRAYYPWPGTWTQVRMNDPHSAKASRGKKLLRIKFLPGKKIQVSGKKPMSYKDFTNGYPEAKDVHSLLGQL